MSAVFSSIFFFFFRLCYFLLFVFVFFFLSLFLSLPLVKQCLLLVRLSYARLLSAIFATSHALQALRYHHLYPSGFFNSSGPLGLQVVCPVYRRSIAPSLLSYCSFTLIRHHGHQDANTFISLPPRNSEIPSTEEN